MSGRKTNGQFDKGNRFATGRPKRAVELDYLAALSEAVPLTLWKDICAKAVADAQAGDDKARAWLAKHLIGEGGSLSDLAKLEALGIGPAEVVWAEADQEVNPGGLLELLSRESDGENKWERAQRLKRADAEALQGAGGDCTGSLPE